MVESNGGWEGGLRREHSRKIWPKDLDLGNLLVESRTGARFRLLFVFTVARPFVCECHSIATMPRFQFPLIEPDGRISRIRLSDKIPAFAFERVGEAWSG